MITNYAKNIYKIIEQADFTEEPKKSKGSGLLAPVKNFMKSSDEDDMNQPVFRIAKYTDTIRKKRMEFKNGGREATEI
tara:strand:+ start:1459 stop:1692 length:234 start_codon:yes stop_codon:yes gene_type:complete